MSMTKINTKMTGEEKVDKISRHIVAEVFRVIDSQKDHLTDREIPTLIFATVEVLVANLVYNVLKTSAEGSSNKKTQYATVEKNFKSVKLNVQDAVAAAFSQAMGKFSGKEIDYYCQLTAVGEPINKRPC